jgi:hypothetical protein
MLKKNGLTEEKERLGEDKETALSENLDSAPPSLARLNGRQLKAEKRALAEHLDLKVGATAELLDCVVVLGFASHY